jgi:GntR family transcriptional regulator, transcriptional repressor for pyruvate dehydrogenase complex
MPDRLPALPARPVRTAPEQISAAIREWILEGTLRAGDRLPSEEKLAETFGVSRPTVRESLRELRSASLLTSSRGRTGGYRVAEMSVRTLGASVAEAISFSLSMQTLSSAQLFEVRSALEVQSAKTAAAHRTEEDLVKLRDAVKILLDLPAHPEDVLTRDLDFHRVLAESTHNPLIIGFAGATTSAFRHIAADVGEISAKQMTAHVDEVVDAVSAGDADGAGQAMHAHLHYFARYFRLA